MAEFVNNNVFTNQDFCYWLQGFFEISLFPELNVNKIKLIQTKLGEITEPLGAYTNWLQTILEMIESQAYNKALIHEWQSKIQSALASIFQHVIDDSYTTEYTKEELQNIHDGIKDI